MSEEKLVRILKDLPAFSRNFLVIHNKDGLEKRFEFNKAQLYVHDRIESQLKNTGRVRANILKGRQQGVSTYTQGRYFHKIITSPGKRAFILTHQADATRAIFEMTKRYSENLDTSIFPQPFKKNENILMYDKPLNSGYRVGTAGNENIGRSMTNQLLHLSEYAFYPKAGSISLGLLQTVADLPGTEVIKESTANGQNNEFYREWQEVKRGDSRYQNIFVPWYWQPEYTIPLDNDFVLSNMEKEWLEEFGADGLTKEALYWRRFKLKEMNGDYEQKYRKFRQEYPLTDEDAFLSSVTDTFLQSENVRNARKNTIDSHSNLIIGIDPARKGDDRTAIIKRRGRKAYDLKTYNGLDTMELCGIIKRIIDKENPARVCIDSIGIGAGIVDRLKELGCDCVEGVNVARKALEPDRYKNLRAELWDSMRSWFLQDMPVEIPDSDELQVDLTCLGYSYDSSDRLKIEGKDDAKKRGLLSPDTADALMLTFFGGEYVDEGGYRPNIIPSHVSSRFI